jgi:hypothetical protein
MAPKLLGLFEDCENHPPDELRPTLDAAPIERYCFPVPNGEHYEEEQFVVSDGQFEFLKSQPWIELDESGKLLTQINSGRKETFIRQRDWEKTQQPFGVEAQAARERIEQARRLKYGETGSDELMLCLHEYAILRNATSTELETFVAAEEAITVCQLKQRGILKAGGLRGKVWEDEERAEAYLHKEFDCLSDSIQWDWPDWKAIEKALSSEEISRIDALFEQRSAAGKMQRDVGQMVSARYIDSHPEKYPKA